MLIGILRAMAIRALGKTLHPVRLDAIPAFVLAYTPPLHYCTASAAGLLLPFNHFETSLFVQGVSLMLIVRREVPHLHAPGTTRDAAGRVSRTHAQNAIEWWGERARCVSV